MESQLVVHGRGALQPFVADTSAEDLGIALYEDEQSCVIGMLHFPIEPGGWLSALSAWTYSG